MSYSQNTSKIIITSDQLRTANLIFLEHKKQSELIPLLNQEIYNWKLVNESWKKTDSLRVAQILYCDSLIKDQNRSIVDLNKSLKRKQNIIKYGSVSSGILILLCLLLK